MRIASLALRSLAILAVSQSFSAWLRKVACSGLLVITK